MLQEVQQAHCSSGLSGACGPSLGPDPFWWDEHDDLIVFKINDDGLMALNLEVTVFLSSGT